MPESPESRWEVLSALHCHSFLKTKARPKPQYTHQKYTYSLRTQNASSPATQNPIWELSPVHSSHYPSLTLPCPSLAVLVGAEQYERALSFLCGLLELDKSLNLCYKILTFVTHLLLTVTGTVQQLLYTCWLPDSKGLPPERKKVLKVSPH